MKKNILYKFFFSLFVFLILLLVNFFIGSKNIQSAATNNFNGGICYACPGCKDVFEICLKRYGFDMYTLIFSLIPISFIIILLNKIYSKNNLLQILFLSVILGLTWLGFIEIIVKLFKIPVLYTHLLEGRQSLHYQFFTLFPEFIIFISMIESMTAGMIGFIVGLIVNKSIIKTTKNRS